MCVLKKPALHMSLHSEQVRTCSGRTISEACHLGVGPKYGELRSHSHATKQEAFVSADITDTCTKVIFNTKQRN